VAEIEIEIGIATGTEIDIPRMRGVQGEKVGMVKMRGMTIGRGTVNDTENVMVTERQQIDQPRPTTARLKVFLRQSPHEDDRQLDQALR
jgi:hypothetical protein